MLALLARLGTVIYILGCVAAVILVLLGFLGLFIGEDRPWPSLILWLLAVIVWAIGYAICYVLGGAE